MVETGDFEEIRVDNDLGCFGGHSESHIDDNDAAFYGTTAEAFCVEPEHIDLDQTIIIQPSKKIRRRSKLSVDEIVNKVTQKEDDFKKKSVHFNRIKPSAPSKSLLDPIQVTVQSFVPTAPPAELLTPATPLKSCLKQVSPSAQSSELLEPANSVKDVAGTKIQAVQETFNSNINNPQAVMSTSKPVVTPVRRNRRVSAKSGAYKATHILQPSPAVKRSYTRTPVSRPVIEQDPDLFLTDNLKKYSRDKELKQELIALNSAPNVPTNIPTRRKTRSSTKKNIEKVSLLC